MTRRCVSVNVEGSLGAPWLMADVAGPRVMCRKTDRISCFSLARKAGTSGARKETVCPSSCPKPPSEDAESESGCHFLSATNWHSILYVTNPLSSGSMMPWLAESSSSLTNRSISLEELALGTLNRYGLLQDSVQVFHWQDSHWPLVLVLFQVSNRQKLERREYFCLLLRRESVFVHASGGMALSTSCALLSGCWYPRLLYCAMLYLRRSKRSGAERCCWLCGVGRRARRTWSWGRREKRSRWDFRGAVSPLRELFYIQYENDAKRPQHTI